MPVRVVLNVAYAMLVKDLSGEQRDEFDADLYGFTQMNERGNRALAAIAESGGED